MCNAIIFTHMERNSAPFHSQSIRPTLLVISPNKLVQWFSISLFSFLAQRAVLNRIFPAENIGEMCDTVYALACSYLFSSESKKYNFLKQVQSTVHYTIWGPVCELIFKTKCKCMIFPAFWIGLSKRFENMRTCYSLLWNITELFRKRRISNGNIEYYHKIFQTSYLFAKY